MIADAPVYWFDEIDSTNEEARRAAQKGDFGPRWIAGKLQTAGRGRLGRQWASPVGNLYVTALFQEFDGITHATRYPFAAGLAVIDACHAFVPETRIELKWPNDVRVAGQKICGILVEAGQSQGKAVWIGCGMGINVQSAPEAAGQAAISLNALGAPVGVDAGIFLDALRPAFAARCRQAKADFSGLLRDWETYAEGLGRQITVGKAAEAPTGTFAGLAPDGALLLEKADGTTQTIRAGDVELVKEVDGDAARN